MTKYIAKLDGKIIGKRKSDRVYTHAIIAQGLQDVARADAYDYKGDKQDRKNFDYYTEIAELGIRHPHAGRRVGDPIVTRQDGTTYDAKAWYDEQSINTIQNAIKVIEGGFDAYVGRLRAGKIAQYEAAVEKGGYLPYVAAWAGRPDLAQKRAAQVPSRYQKLVAVVEAEVA